MRPDPKDSHIVDLLVILTVFGVVFLAELPDKTALASLVLGTRYKPLHVFVGTAAAFFVHVVLAIAAGSLLTLLPGRVLHAVVGALFLMGAILLLRGRHEEEEDEELELKGDKPATFRRVAGMSFGVILVAEFGDLTQIVTANLAAKYHDPISVGIGATLGLWAVAGLAIVGGRGLLKVVPLTVVTRVAAAIMGALAVFSIVEAIRG
ncbi:TMEM165/GDT1 family protein [Catenulispora sp. NF23]|uniref:GDT1 family protein n=1 Tax=Catenulispora pinistramenti TaxID=2705254 RepID=A0ABS5L8G8_9ACTN|nr:TMEM165/GDT1 family protein [Catenulispora pinistramenti]MBS2539911.1 TMEM165/GDT1 family protein [Catenulispora pinistramenti]MBS2554638.1 TMEM165/GDT1 family protein [Catenulispora pinistramenti]